MRVLLGMYSRNELGVGREGKLPFKEVIPGILSITMPDGMVSTFCNAAMFVIFGPFEMQIKTSINIERTSAYKRDLWGVPRGANPVEQPSWSEPRGACYDVPKLCRGSALLPTARSRALLCSLSTPQASTAQTLHQPQT